MSAGEFGGIGFAPGVVRGTRSFDVDKLGRLTGVSYKQVWSPGENTAECRKGDYASGGFIIPTIQWSFTLTTPTAPVPEPSPEAKKAMDKVAKEWEKKIKADALDVCTHGFYGYYDGSNDYYERGRVMGVIEGYGETVIGTRGFRCMKARIVALRIPEPVDPRLRALVLRNYSGIPFFETFERMVTEFPCDAAGMELSPESDPDFWTRAL